MKYLAIISILLLAAGCVTERKVVEYIDENPSILDNYFTLDTGKQEPIIDTIYSSDTVTVFIPGETVIDSFEIRIPPSYSSDTLTKTTALATGKAWISNQKIYLQVIQHENYVQVELDSAKMHIRRLERELITETLRPPAEKIPPKWWWRASFWILLGEIVVIIVGLIVLKLLKKLKL